MASSSSPASEPTGYGQGFKKGLARSGKIVAHVAQILQHEASAPLPHEGGRGLALDAAAVKPALAGFPAAEQAARHRDDPACIAFEIAVHQPKNNLKSTASRSQVKLRRILVAPKPRALSASKDCGPSIT